MSKHEKMKSKRKMKAHRGLMCGRGHLRHGHAGPQRHGDDGWPGEEEHHLGAMIHKVARMMSRAQHPRHHARHAQGRVLEILHREGPMKQRDLLEVLDVRSSSLSELLGKLERKGVILRSRDPEDGRGFIVEAAEPELTDGPASDHSSHPRDPFEALNPQEQEDLATMLGKVILTMKKNIKEHRR